MTYEQPPTRASLMALHAKAVGRRSSLPLGSEEYRRAADEIASIEVAIAAATEAAAGTPSAEVRSTAQRAPGEAR